MRGNLALWLIVVLLAVPVAAADRGSDRARPGHATSGEASAQRAAPDIEAPPAKDPPGRPIAAAASAKHEADGGSDVPSAPRAETPGRDDAAPRPEADPPAPASPDPEPVPSDATPLPPAGGVALDPVVPSFRPGSILGPAPAWAQETTGGAGPIGDAPSGPTSPVVGIPNPLDLAGPTMPDEAGASTPQGVGRYAAAMAVVRGIGSLPGVGTAAGLLVGVTAGVLVTRAYANRSRPRATAPARPPLSPLEALLRRVDLNPFDGEARVLLGIQLLQHGQEAAALRHLAQGFRYHPAGILAILQDPKLAFVRDHTEVRRILRRFHRDQSRRVWAGYT